MSDLLRRSRWAIAMTVFVLVGGAVAAPAVRDAVSRLPVTGAHLVRPPLYVAIAPLSDTLDAMSLLSVPQLIALTVSLIIAFAAWRRLRLRGAKADRWCEFCLALRAFLLYVLIVIFAAVLPRPMAALRMDDENLVIFDIHSHTNYSHDARATFTVEQNRAWHRDAGFDVAYITDHRCLDGAAEGERGNPKVAGDGTLLLSGIELPPDQMHIIELEPPDAAVPDDLLETWCVRAKAGRALAIPPVRIQTIPENLNHMPVAPAGGLGAIELLDGAPRGIAQAQRDRRTLLTLSAMQRLALVAGSNNHGWGRTAVAWNVMHIHQWRRQPPDSVGAQIEMRIRAERAQAVQVIERRTPDGASPLGLALTLPAVVANVMRTMSAPERASWIAWTWALALVTVVARRRRPA